MFGTEDLCPALTGVGRCDFVMCDFVTDGLSISGPKRWLERWYATFTDVCNI